VWAPPWAGRLAGRFEPPSFLLYALPLALSLCEALLLQGCDGTCLLPLLGYLAPLYAVDLDNLVRGSSTGRCETLVLFPIVDATSRRAGHHLILFGDLIVDDVADVGEGTLFFGNYPQVALAVVRFLVSGMMIDEVGAIISFTVSRSPLACAPKKRAHQYLVPLLSLRQRSILLHLLTRLFLPGRHHEHDASRRLRD
jgi:hypothetical protein